MHLLVIVKEGCETICQVTLGHFLHFFGPAEPVWALRAAQGGAAGHRFLGYYRSMRLSMQGPSRLVLRPLGRLPVVVLRLALRGLVLLPLVLPGAGCSADLEALYADEQALVALLPARPDDEVAAACGMCALEQCEEERLDCERDDGCARLLKCRGKCSDPACLFECEAEHAARGEHNNFHTCWYESACTRDDDCMSECEREHEAAETYDAYRACVFEQACRDECATGQNWQCLGDYSWKPGDDGFVASPRLTVMVKDSLRLIDPGLRGPPLEPGAEGVNVDVCPSPRSDSAELCLTRVTNALGIAVLEDLPLEDDGTFQGYLRFSLDGSIVRITPDESIVRVSIDESDDNGIAQDYAIGRPIYRELTMEHVVVPKREWLDDVESSMRIRPDRDAGHIMAVVRDCLNAPAPGIEFSLAGDHPGRSFYGVDAPEQAPGTETNETGMGGFGNIIDVGMILGSTWSTIRALRSGDGVLVSEKFVEVRADTLTRVDLYPLATSDGSSARE